jgi:hypothetical protein
MLRVKIDDTNDLKQIFSFRYAGIRRIPREETNGPHIELHKQDRESVNVYCSFCVLFRFLALSVTK